MRPSQILSLSQDQGLKFTARVVLRVLIVAYLGSRPVAGTGGHGKPGRRKLAGTAPALFLIRAAPAAPSEASPEEVTEMGKGDYITEFTNGGCAGGCIEAENESELKNHTI